MDILPPTVDDLIDELKTLRRVGLLRLPNSRFVALEQATLASGRIGPQEPQGPYVVERMLRDVVVCIGGDIGQAATVIFGLAEGGRADRPAELRKLGAQLMSVSTEHFRHHYEPIIFGQLAHLLLGQIHDYRLRLSRLRSETRTPVGSRLAVEWLSRFEAMYAIWSPLTGVGGDLTAARATMQEEKHLWNRSVDPDDPDSQDYSREIQAVGYVTNALYHFSVFLCCKRDFKTRFGGLWLLADVEAESDLASAVHRAVLASPNNERDDSYLRLLMGRSTDRELHDFMRLVSEDKTAMAIHDEWQQWADSCSCQWKPGDRRGRELFPTAANHLEIATTCQVHQLISACNDFCLILDDGWDQVADWYRDIEWPRKQNLSAEEIYDSGRTP